MRLGRSLPFLGMPIGWNPQIPILSVSGSSNTDLFSSTGRLTVNMVSDSVAHVKGAWAEVVASTSSDIFGLVFWVSNSANGANGSTLMDIGIGASGSEVVVAPDLNVSKSVDGYAPFQIPIFIPAGSRVAIRCQSARTTTTMATIFAGGLTNGFSDNDPFNRNFSSSVVMYGNDTSISNGTLLTAPGSLNTKGAWTEITAATNEPLKGIVIFANQGTGTTDSGGQVLVDVAVGASGSEIVVANNYSIGYSTLELTNRFSSGLYAVDIPANSRLSARFQRSGTITCRVSLMGVPK